MTIDIDTPEGVDRYIQSEIGKWSKVVKEAEIRAPD